MDFNQSLGNNLHSNFDTDIVVLGIIEQKDISMEGQMTAALKTEEGKFEVKQVERVKLVADDWVVARVKVSGICGTDLRHWKKHEPELACKIMGHEMSGEVVEVGKSVTNVKP